jgi:alkylhydroperoxidase family enzyme
VASWIPGPGPGRDDDPLTALLPPALALAHDELWRRLWAPGTADPVVLEGARLRTAVLLGCPGQAAVRLAPARAAGLDEEAGAALAAGRPATGIPAAATALALAEQFVLDPAGVSPGDRAGARHSLGLPGLVGLVYGLALFDGMDRARLVLGLEPEEDAVPRVLDPPAPRRPAPPGPAGGAAPGEAAFAAAQPGLYRDFTDLYAALWHEGVVDHPTKEAVRLRNARVTGCRFCRNVRFARAREDGLGEDLVDLITDDHARSALPARLRRALALADVFLLDPGGGTPPRLRAELLEEFGPAGTVELAFGLALFAGFSKGTTGARTWGQDAVALGAFPEDFPVQVIPTPVASPEPPGP